MALLRKRNEAAKDESHLQAESPLKRMRLGAGSMTVEGQDSKHAGEDGSPPSFQQGFQEVDNSSTPTVKAQPGRKLFSFGFVLRHSRSGRGFSSVGRRSIGIGSFNRQTSSQGASSQGGFNLQKMDNKLWSSGLLKAKWIASCWRLRVAPRQGLGRSPSLDA